jgi:hypothetical protein
VVLGVGVEQPPNHSLVLRVMLARFGFEEIDAALAQGDRHLDALVAEDEILWRWKEVRNDPQLSQWFVGIPDFLAHKLACLCASNRHR